MNSPRRTELDVEELLKELNVKNLYKPALILGLLAVIAIVFFITILIHAIFTKLDANTEYSINVATQVVQYEPNDSAIPTVNLPSFSVIKGSSQCQRIEENDWIKNGELTFYENSYVIFRVHKENEIKLSVEPLVEDTRIAQLISPKGRCVLKEKFALTMRLTEAEPDFISILVGKVTLGKTLSYATETMPALLQNGSVEVKDYSFWFEDPIGLSSITLSMGDTVLLPADEKNAATGLLTISQDENAFTGVFNKKGGEVRITKPFASNQGNPISVSFFERLYNDNALTITLSVSFIVIQALMFLITTLIRLTYIPKNSDLEESHSVPSKGEEALDDMDTTNEKTN